LNRGRRLWRSALRSARSSAQHLGGQKSSDSKKIIAIPARLRGFSPGALRARAHRRATPPGTIEKHILAARKVRRGLLENLNWTRVCPNLPRTAHREKIVSGKQVQLRLEIELNAKWPRRQVNKPQGRNELRMFFLADFSLASWRPDVQ
jgi:hypothetical protein